MPPAGDHRVEKIPTLKDGASSLDWLCGLLLRTRGAPARITFDFRSCGWVSQDATVVLGAVFRSLLRSGREVYVSFAENSPVQTHLSRNGFLSAFKQPTLPETGHAIPFREDRSFAKDDLISYLTDHWIGRGWINVSHKLRSAIVGTVSEIYLNAFEHSGSEVGVVTCGQHYSATDRLHLSVADCGIGIVENVRRHYGRPDIPAMDALKWAFRKGTTTCGDGMGRGLGLDLLREFVQLNRGKLQVLSNDGQISIDERGPVYRRRSIVFPGTLVRIELRCDERLYRFRDETSSPALKEKPDDDPSG